MKKSGRICAMMLACAPAATAMAASGAEHEGISLLMVMFLGFGALIVSFQGVLVVALLFSMAKALISRPVKRQHAAFATSRSDDPA